MKTIYIQFKKGLHRFLVSILVCTAILSSCGNEDVFNFPDNPPAYELTGMKEIFGFYNQQRYSYCPSVIKEDDGTVHMYFCGNPDEQIMVDNIYYVRINPDGTQTPAVSVLQPTENTWDSHHTCDPSVIAGNFSMGGNKYTYAMFFLGNRLDRYYNEIGVAFSNDLAAGEWIKYPGQLIAKTWEEDEDQTMSNGNLSWGVGQPSAVSLDKAGKVLLTYTIGDVVATRIAWVELDMSNMDQFAAPESQTMLSTGLKQINNVNRDYTANAEFAICPEENLIVMIRPVHPHPTDYPNFLNTSLEVNYMPLNAFMASVGYWSVLIRITPEMTGYPRNHNAALERNAYGEISNPFNPVVYYTVSKAAPEVSPTPSTHAEWTYHIWRGEVK